MTNALAKRLIQSALRKVGFELRRIQPPRVHDEKPPYSMEAALVKWAASTKVNTVIDVGASNGCWTRLALKGWPDAQYLLVEAQKEPHERGLMDLTAQCPNADYIIAAAGPRNGIIYFDASDPFGGVASESPMDGNCISVPVIALDDEVRDRNLNGPFLLKFDTHGFEVPILLGATRLLSECSLLVVECYNFDISPECLRFPQFCAYLEELGFRCVDICDVLRRPSDGFLWQFDLFFARIDRPEFTQNIYNTETEMIEASKKFEAGQASLAVATEYGVGEDTVLAWASRHRKASSRESKEAGNLQD